jgi:hypothetical protein
MTTATQAETTRYTIQLDATDLDWPWMVIDPDGDESDRFESRADAEEEAAAMNATLAAERAEQELDDLREIAQEIAAACDDPGRLRRAIALLVGRPCPTCGGEGTSDGTCPDCARR